MRKRLVGLAAVLISIVGTPIVSEAGMKLTAELDRNSASVKEVFYLTVRVEVDNNDRLSSLPEIPNIAGLVVQNPKQQGPTFVTINNRSYVEYILYYAIYALQTGEYRIEGIAVRQGNNIYPANPVVIKIVEAGNTVQLGGNGLLAVAQLDKEEVYRGEQVILTIDVYSQRPIVGTPAFIDQQSFEGFFMQQIRSPWRLVQTNLGGTPCYKGSMPVSFALFPLSSGDVTIPPIAIEVGVQEGSSQRRSRSPMDSFFNDPFFGDPFSRGRAYSIATKPLTINVKSLPEEGQPDGFFGAVGRMTLDVQVRPENRKVKVGQAITLTATLTGEANFSQINSPIWPDLGSFAAHDNSPELEFGINENNRVVGRRKWEKVLIVRNGDTTTIGPIRVPYFDPETKSYVDLAGDPIEFVIDASSLDGREYVVINGRNIEIDPEDFRYIATDAESLGNQGERLYDSPMFWVANVFPVFFVTAAGFFQRRQQRIYTDERFARRVRAPKRTKVILSEAGSKMSSGALGEYYGLLSKALLDLIEDRLGFSARGLVHENMAEQLKTAGVEGSLAEEVVEFLKHLDNARFSKAEALGKPSEDLDKVKGLVDRLLRI